MKLQNKIKKPYKSSVPGVLPSFRYLLRIVITLARKNYHLSSIVCVSLILNSSSLFFQTRIWILLSPDFNSHGLHRSPDL